MTENAAPRKRSFFLWRWLKRLLKFIGITLVLLIAAAIIIPYFFKKQILEAVKDYINTKTTATVDFKDVHLSLLWTFPEFSFEMDSFSVTGQGVFEGLKLADMRKFRVGIDVWSVFSGKYQVTGLSLQDANFYVKVLQNGQANYDLMKPDTTAVKEPDKPSEGSSDFSLKLDYYELKNVNLIYDDAPSKLYAEVKGLEHTGSGRLYTDDFKFYTKTKIDALSFSSNRIRYLNKAKIALELNAHVDNVKKKYTLMDNSLRINALELNMEGSVEQPNDKDLDLDLKFNAPKTAFAQVLSLIPAAYTKDFDGVKTSGNFAFNGFAKGRYNAKSLPAFAVNLSIDNAEFQYPTLPLGVKDIQAKIAVNSPSSDLDKMSIDVSKFHFQLGSNPFDMTLQLRTPLSDPDIDTKINGKIQLEELAKAFPMEGVSQLNGLINADLEAKTRMSYVETKQYDRVQMRGLLAVNNMNYQAQGSAPMLVNELRLEFTPNNVDLKNFDMRMGKSDLRAVGKLDNLLTYFSRTAIMKGNLTVNSNTLDINELSGPASTEPADPKAATNMVDTTSAPASSEKPFDAFEFAMETNVGRVFYDVYEIKDLRFKGALSPARAELSNLQLLVGKVDVQASGYMENVFGYVFDNTLLKGVLNINSNYLNINQFMTSDGKAAEPEPQPVPADPSAAKSEMQPLALPANLDFALNGNFTQLIYDTYKLRNAKAKLHLHHQILEIIELSANALGGSIALNGEYDSRNPKKPSFKFGYNLVGLDIQEVARTVGISQYFLPIMKSFFGKFSSNLKLAGLLDQNMYPDLRSLTAEGTLKTMEAVLRNFNPTRKLGQLLRIKELDEVPLKNTTNFLKIKDGRVIFEKFTDEFKGIGFSIEGSHGLDNTLKYDLQLRIPRKILESNPLGAAAGQAVNTGIQLFNNEAQKLGIQLQQSDIVHVGVDITGSMSDPQFKIRLIGAEKAGQSLGNQLVTTAKEELDKLKAEAEAKARAEAERLKAEAEAKARAEADRLKAEAEAKAKEVVDKAKAEADRLKAEAEAKAKAAAEKAKAEAEAKAKAAAEKLKAEERAKFVQDSIKKALQNKNPIKNPFGGG